MDRSILFTIIIFVIISTCISTNVTSLESGSEVTFNAIQGYMSIFSIPVSLNNEVDLQIFSDSDFNFYVYPNAPPTIDLNVYSNYFSASVFNSFQLFSCDVTDNFWNGTMYFGLTPFSNTIENNVQLTVTINPKLCETPLTTSSVTFGLTSLNSGEWLYYEINLNQTNMDILSIGIQSTLQDLQIFANEGTRPTYQNYEYISGSSTNPQLVLNCLSSGHWYFGVTNSGQSSTSYTGTFQDLPRMCYLPITSGFSETFNSLSGSTIYYVLEVTSSNSQYLLLTLDQATSTQVYMYIQKNAVPTSSNFLISNTGLYTETKQIVVGPCNLEAAHYYIGVYIVNSGSYTFQALLQNYNCTTYIYPTYTSYLSLNSNEWAYYSYVVDYPQQMFFYVSSTALTVYAQYNTYPTSFDYYLESSYGAYLDSCSYTPGQTLYFSLTSTDVVFSFSVSLTTNARNCSVVLQNGVKYDELASFTLPLDGGTYYNFYYEFFLPNYTGYSITISSYSKIYVSFNSTPTTSSYQFYSYDYVNFLPLPSQVGTWRILVYTVLKPFSIIYNINTRIVNTPATYTPVIPTTTGVDCEYYSTCLECTHSGCSWCWSTSSCSISTSSFHCSEAYTATTPSDCTYSSPTTTSVAPVPTTQCAITIETFPDSTCAGNKINTQSLMNEETICQSFTQYDITNYALVSCTQNVFSAQICSDSSCTLCQANSPITSGSCMSNFDTTYNLYNCCRSNMLVASLLVLLGIVWVVHGLAFS